MHLSIQTAQLFGGQPAGLGNSWLTVPWGIAITGIPVPGRGGGSVWPAFGLTPTNALTGLAENKN